ncbi:MAG: hypothetical protein Q9163_003040 [Psora crenata]
MHFLSTLVVLGLNASSPLGGTFGWIGIYEQYDLSCQYGYFVDEQADVSTYRPTVGGIGKAQINWSPAAVMGDEYNITTFGVNWGTGEAGFQFQRLAFYADKGCSSGWLGTLERPAGKYYDADGVKTCFVILDRGANIGAGRDGRAVQCIRSEKAEGDPPPGPGAVFITDECPDDKCDE